MKKLLALVLLVSSVSLFAQEVEVQGNVVDPQGFEALMSEAQDAANESVEKNEWLDL
jgi:hypothetical protein